jgi:membrane fusion protein, multidrug efflux system
MNDRPESPPAAAAPSAPPSAPPAAVASSVVTVEVATKPRRRFLRFLLLVLVPLAAAGAGIAIYLHGGRYITTDNAYVNAQKVLVTPEISGTVSSIAVAEGQHLKQGDILFTIDPKPYELALAQAKGALFGAQTDYNGLKVQYAGLDPQIALARETVDLKRTDLDRKTALAANKVVAATDVDSAKADLQTARSALEVLQQTQRDIASQLGGSPDMPVDVYPPYARAKVAVDQAQWNLDQTVLKAPMDGIATQVDNIQLGRYLSAGTTVFAIVSGKDIWLDANPKETDITYLAPGQQVDVTVDTFSGRTFTGHVESISPGTGAQFSIIPPQNAAGNWVKVVQRVPVRIAFDPGQNTSMLRAGMSANVSIDTHRTRSLAGLLGMVANAETPGQ